MKKLLFLLLIVTEMANAQIVNIPDPVFKAKLLSANIGIDIASTATPVYDPNIFTYSVSSYNSIDANGDGEIQVSEALLIKYLNISSNNQNDNIHDLTGIEYFTNIQFLNCINNSLTSMNISSCTTLEGLYCYSNQLTSLDVSSNTALNYLYCYSNQLTSLDVTHNVNLINLRCGSNQLTSLDVTHNVNLIDLWCYSNQLTSLDVTHNLNLVDLLCYSNQLTSLDISNNTALNNLVCDYNQLTSLDVTHNINLLALQCYSNQLTSLDVSSNIALEYLDCNNNQLTSLLIKNGRVENTLIFGNNPNLTYICADEAQISSIQAQAGANVMVSSYCSFTPGGNHNTVSGVVRFDMDNNGCDASDSALPNSVHLNITDGTVSSGTFPTTDGSYLLYTLTGNNVLTTSLENSSYFTITPTTSTINTTTLGTTQTQDFCITANGIHNDVEVIIIPIRRARPGFDAEYKIVYKNKGNQTLSGTVNFNYDDAVLDYISSSVNPNTQSTGNLAWNYTNLLPFESRSFNVVLNVNAPTETPAVNIGDVLDYSATINPVSGDETSADNIFAFNQTVVGAYDPNDKTCLEGAIVSPTKIGDYLHYNINFENTGNSAAENIVVKDIIDTTKFDVNSLQIMNSSHAMTTKMSGNKVEFVFQNINLGASQHGNVVFKIKTKSTLVTGNSVTNKADIYFDYNFPIATNTATTTFQTLSSGEFEIDSSVKVYPNPAKNNVNVNCNSTIKSIELFDIQGRILTTKIVDDTISNFDISNYSNGVYFVRVTTEKGSKVEKVIKE